MCSKKRSRGLIAISALVLAGCNSPVDPESGSIKYVSLPETMTAIRMDSASLSAISRGAAPLHSSMLAKSVTAKIEPIAIKVMTIGYREHGMHSEQPMYKKAPAPNTWEYLVEMYQNNDFEQIVYLGSLEQNGDYATGRVGVQKGYNSILLGFIMPGDTLFNTGYWASYLWGADSSGWSSSYGHGDTLRFEQPRTQPAYTVNE